MKKGMISFGKAVQLAKSVELDKWIHYESGWICTRTHDSAYRAVFRGQRDDKYIFMRGDMVFDNEPMGEIKKNPQQHRTLRNLFVKIHRQKEGNKPLFRGY